MPKLKNSAVCGDLVGGERAARDFDHRADHVVELHLLLGHDFLGDAMDDLDLEIEFLLEADERDHDFRLHLDAFLLDLGGGFEDGAGLHLGDFRIDDAEAAAAEAEHRVELVQFLDALVDLLDRHAHLRRRGPAAPRLRAAGTRAAAGRGSGSWPGSLSAP